ncbi:MAG: hypothetical protein AAF611_09660 [Bacteroidota bacterium]
MKKIIFLTLFSISLIACSNDDDTPTDTNALIGTTWIGQETNDGIYTFASAASFTFVDEGEIPVNGTYTFDGNNGVLTEDTGFTADFTVSGGIMTVQGINATRVYIKQE